MNNKDMDKELAIAIVASKLHAGESIDREHLMHTLQLVVETLYPQALLDTPCGHKGMALDITNPDRVIGFIGGVLYTLNMQGMPTMITDENYLRIVTEIIVSLKRKDMLARLKMAEADPWIIRNR